MCKQRRQAAVEDEVVDAGGGDRDMTLCERCGCGDREEALLLCDGNESKKCIFQKLLI